MRLLINASNLSSAGGLTVALNFLENIKDNKTIKINLIAPRNCGYEKFEAAGIEVNYLKNWQRNHLGRVLFDYYILKKIVAKVNPDAIFTMGNFAIPVKDYKQLLLFMWPYAIYPEAMNYLTLSFKGKLIQKLRLLSFKNRLQYANIVAPQTEVANTRLKKYFPNVKSTHVVPTAYSVIKSDTSNKKDYSFLRSHGRITLLCLSRYYVHKNIEVLAKVAEILKERNLNYQIVITIDESEHENVKKINREIQDKKLENYLHNLGNVPIYEVSNLYNFVDAVILPTLLESFSAVYADAMYLSKPIFTSDKDFSREICKDTAFYFDPNSPEQIVDIIDNAYKNPDHINEKVKNAHNLALSFPDWKAISNSYLNLINELINTSSSNESGKNI